MQKISLQEFRGLELKHYQLSPKRQAISSSLNSLKRNEAVKIETKDWDGKGNPTQFVYNLGKKFNYGFTVRVLANNEGWAVLRVR